MLERCARAICRAERYDEDASWELYVPHARAVIEALMTPTPEMLASAEVGYITSMTDDHHNMNVAKDIFVSMLRTILSQPNDDQTNSTT